MNKYSMHGKRIDSKTAHSRATAIHAITTGDARNVREQCGAMNL